MGTYGFNRSVALAWVVLLVGGAAAYGGCSDRDFYIYYGKSFDHLPPLLDDKGQVCQYTGPPLRNLIVDALVDGNDVSMILFRISAFAQPGYTAMSSVDIVDRQVTIDVHSTPPPPMDGPLIAGSSNLFETVVLADLAPGEYHVTGNWYNDGVFSETYNTSFSIPVPEPGTLSVLAISSLMWLHRRRGFA